MTNFNKSEYITIISKRQKVVISVSSILYIIMEGKSAEIHLSDGKIYSTRMTFAALEEMLGDGFIKHTEDVSYLLWLFTKYPI